MVVGVAENRTVDLLELLDHVLHDDALREFLGVVDLRDQFLTVGRGADADRRSEVGRLNDHRIAELLLDFLDQGVATGVPLAVGKPNVVYHRNPLFAENHLHRDLVHAVGARKSVAAGERNADRLEKALEHAVLTVGAVEHWNGHMQLGGHGILLREETCVDLVEIEVAIFRTHEDLFGLFGHLLHVAIVADVEKVLARIPASLLRNVNGDYVIFLLVECIDCLKGRNHGDLMFHRTTSKKYCYVCLHCFVNSMSAGLVIRTCAY